MAKRPKAEERSSLFVPLFRSALSGEVGGVSKSSVESEATEAGGDGEGSVSQGRCASSGLSSSSSSGMVGNASNR